MCHQKCDGTCERPRDKDPRAFQTAVRSAVKEPDLENSLSQAPQGCAAAVLTPWLVASADTHSTSNRDCLEQNAPCDSECRQVLERRNNSAGSVAAERAVEEELACAALRDRCPGLGCKNPTSFLPDRLRA